MASYEIAISFFHPRCHMSNRNYRCYFVSQRITHMKTILFLFLLTMAFAEFSTRLYSQGYWSDIVVTGDPTPTGDGDFGSFASVQLNNAGDVAFASLLTGTSAGSQNNAGVFLAPAGGSLVELLREMDPAPDGNGTLSSFSLNHLNESGQFVTYSSLKNTSGGNGDDGGIFLVGPSGIAQVAREGQTLSSGTFTSSFSGTSAINHLGQVAFLAQQSGTSGGASNDQALFLWDDGAYTELARKGDPTPDGDGLISMGQFTISMNDFGQTAFYSNVSGSANNQGIFGTTGSTLVQYARAGQVISNGTFSILSRSSAQINNAGQVFF